jgi:hypothetical protein
MLRIKKKNRQIFLSKNSCFFLQKYLQKLDHSTGSQAKFQIFAYKN